MWGQVTPWEPAGGAAIFACSWDDVEGNGRLAPSIGDLRIGASWSWQGPLWRLDTPEGPLRLEGAIGRASLHRVMARRAARMSWFPGERPPLAALSRIAAKPAGGDRDAPADTPAPATIARTVDLALAGDTFVFAPPRPRPRPESGHEAGRPTPTRPAEDIPSLLRDAFVVTDGVDTWPVSLIPAASTGPALALFEGAVPPQDTALWIVSSRLGTGRAPPRGGAGFAFGTQVETMAGLCTVEELRPGQEIITDGGPCRIREIRRRRAARTILIPPGFFDRAGPEHPVLVGRDCWIGLEGSALSALFSLPEALVRAGDLVTQPGVQLMGAATLITLGLGHSGLIMAGGLPFLCGLPLQSALRPLSCGEAQITLSGPPGRVRPHMVFRGAA